MSHTERGGVPGGEKDVRAEEEDLELRSHRCTKPLAKVLLLLLPHRAARPPQPMEWLASAAVSPSSSAGSSPSPQRPTPPPSNRVRLLAATIRIRYDDAWWGGVVQKVDRVGDRLFMKWEDQEQKSTWVVGLQDEEFEVVELRPEYARRPEVTLALSSGELAVAPRELLNRLFLPPKAKPAQRAPAPAPRPAALSPKARAKAERKAKAAPAKRRRTAAKRTASARAWQQSESESESESEGAAGEAEEQGARWGDRRTGPALDVTSKQERALAAPRGEAAPRACHCGAPAVGNSKYCSTKCGVQGAETALRAALTAGPDACSAAALTTADWLDVAKFQELLSVMDSLRLRLAEGARQKKRLEEAIERNRGKLTPLKLGDAASEEGAAPEEGAEGLLMPDPNVMVDCCACGKQFPARQLARHSESCFDKSTGGRGSFYYDPGNTGVVQNPREKKARNALCGFPRAAGAACELGTGVCDLHRNWEAHQRESNSRHCWALEQELEEQAAQLTAVVRRLRLRQNNAAAGLTETNVTNDAGGVAVVAGSVEAMAALLS